MTVGFIGLGLIGGSIAKTLRRVSPNTRIIAYNRTRSVLDAAREDNIVDLAVDDVDKRFAVCDIIFLCVPVITMIDYIKKLKPIMKPGCILTDVGSTKTEIHEAVHAAGLDDHFIGGHPMAGSEKTGYANATDRMIENAWYILTPAENVPIQRVSEFSEFISSLGALPMVLNYKEHDYVVAAISHLPHVVSASLVNLVHELDSPDGTMKAVAAGGFKDITRISSSSPQMWQEICLANSENICILLDRYMRKLTDFQFAIRNHDKDKLITYFTECKDYRDSFSDVGGSLPQTYRIYVDVPDEPGVIARAATLLAENDVSLKNIGIVHNRDYEDGVLRIEFYEQDALDRGIQCLEKKGYTVHK
ncbi:MAG: prephenate dehydrogenase [Lachnospiraceae bacterium]|nr:prephenate dehydrogenase [Lachnospiraceae bacterium]